MGANSFYSEEELKKIGFQSYGENVCVSRNASIYSPEKISLGNNVRIDDFCILSGNITVGDNVHLAAAVLLYGGEEGILIRDYCCISSRGAVYALTDDYSGEYMTNATVPNQYKNVKQERVVLQKHVLIGTGSTILPGVLIGEGTAVGAMSLVNRSLESWGMYVGVPCKKIKDRSRKLLEIEKEFIEEQRIQRDNK